MEVVAIIQFSISKFKSTFFVVLAFCLKMNIMVYFRR